MSQAQQLAAALSERRDALAQEAMALQAELVRHTAEADRLEAQVERNRRELAGYLVPDIDDETLGALERRFHYPSLLTNKAAFVAAIAAAEAERAALEADQTFIDREVLRVEAQQTLADVGPSLAEVEATKAPWDTCPRHATLIAAGFYESNPPGGFARKFSFWRQGSFLMAELEKKRVSRFSDLADLRARWQAILADYTALTHAAHDAEETLKQMDGLEARHRHLLAEPADQFKACFEALGRALVDHLLALPEDSLVEFARSDPSLASFLKKDAGLRKQVAYLREIAQVRLQPSIRTLEAEATKADGKASRIFSKLSRGRAVPATTADVQRARSYPRDKWEKRRTSLGKTRERLGGYHDYDRGSFLTTYLWWDVMTHGAHGDDLYEVRTFHERNPGWTPAAFVDPTAVGLTAAETYRDDAASAFADQLMADDPANGLFDAS